MRLAVTISSAVTTAIGMIPPAVRDFLRDRTNEAMGIAALFAAGWAALALASWNPADPSLNHATTVEPQNWLGTDGALAADLMLQAVGVSPFRL